MPTKRISRKAPTTPTRGRGPAPRWTERVDASVSPEMKARMDRESQETGLSSAGIVRIALKDYFERKDGEVTV